MDGVLFYYFRTGVNRSTQATADGRVEVWENARHSKTRHLGTTFWTRVDSQPLGRRFLKFETAARAGLKALSQVGEPQ